MKQWKAPGEMTTPVAEVDLRVGGKYRIHMRAPDGALHRLVGAYRVIDPPRKLVYTWRWEDDPDAGETLVTVEFLGRGNSTDLVLTQELFATDDLRQRHETGWTKCFEKLSVLMERR